MIELVLQFLFHLSEYDRCKKDYSKAIVEFDNCFDAVATLVSYINQPLQLQTIPSFELGSFDRRWVDKNWGGGEIIQTRKLAFLLLEITTMAGKGTHTYIMDVLNKDSIFRNLIWNFRDISDVNRCIISQKIFRSSNLCEFQFSRSFINTIEEYKIELIIDLRSKREIIRNPFSDRFIQPFTYVTVPFDHYNSYIMNCTIESQIAFFLDNCKSSIKKAINYIAICNGGIIIQCQGGKKRTGIFIIILHLILNTQPSDILQDYLLSELDTEEKYFTYALKHIYKYGGIEEYLLSCNVDPNTLVNIKNKFLRKL